MARWPTTRAFYFLDADNLIEPKSLARAYAIICSDPKIGWAYPDIAMFGSVEETWDYAGRYSILRHLINNVSEAGSMVSREVFDRGCYFDELMRQGYEDWEFWWQCIDAGFVGRHVPFFGLRYRKRPESMLSQSEREHAAVVSYMQRKHRQLFRTKRLLALEAADAPRYAIVENAHRVRICTDPRDDGEIIDGASLASRYLAASQQPQIHLARRFVIAASPEATDLLKHLRLDRFVFWWLEKQASNDDGPHFMAVELATGSPQRGIAMAVMEPGYWPVEAEAIHMMMAAPRILRECIGDDNDEWTQSLLSSAPQPRTAVLRIEVAEKLFPALVLPDAVTQWFEIFDPLHESRRHLVSPVPIIKPRSLISNHILGRTPATLLECGCLLQLTDPAKRDICFVLPLVAFGGVEKVALKVATEFVGPVGDAICWFWPSRLTWTSIGSPHSTLFYFITNRACVSGRMSNNISALTIRDGRWRGIRNGSKDCCCLWMLWLIFTRRIFFALPGSCAARAWRWPHRCMSTINLNLAGT